MIKRGEFSYLDMNRDLFKLLLAVAHDTAGIAMITYNVSTCFADSDPSAVRKAKRKFRKLWRNASLGKNSKLNTSQKGRLGRGSPQPSRAQKRTRRCIVNEMIVNRVKENYMLVTKQKP